MLTRIVVLMACVQFAATCGPNAPLPGEAPLYTISPETVVPAKTYTIAVQAANCSASTKQLANVSVLVSGSGLTLEQVNKDQDQTCIWTGTLTVAQDAEFSDASVILQWKDKPSVPLPIHVVSKPAGPIPPGLKPTVDIAWKVVSRKIASDSFGTRITKLYYTIEVVIGNNSGYDLQVAAIEFELPGNPTGDTAKGLENSVPSDSYFVVRSSLEREQAIGKRSTTVNIVKAIGPVLTGGTLFFNGSSLAALHHKTVFEGIANVFSSPFEKGLELVMPDQTVRQLINLDNRSLRDGLIIANNTQIRSIVFVDRELISRSALNEAKISGDRQPEAKRTAQGLGVGGRMSGLRSHDYDPQTVMKKLGKLVLIGRSIEYLNRVSVISSPPGPAPLITGKSGDSATEGGDPVHLVLTGESLSGAKLTSPDPNLVIANPAIGDGGKSFTATIDPKKAQPKSYPLTLSTASGSQTVPFVVNPADIVVPPPSPGITVVGGEEKTVSVSGARLKNVTGVTTKCTGVAVTSDLSGSDASLPVRIVAGDSAPANPNCTVIVTGKSGNTQTFPIAVTAKGK